MPASARTSGCTNVCQTKVSAIVFDQGVPVNRASDGSDPRAARRLARLHQQVGGALRGAEREARHPGRDGEPLEVVRLVDEEQVGPNRSNVTAGSRGVVERVDPGLERSRPDAAAHHVRAGRRSPPAGRVRRRRVVAPTTRVARRPIRAGRRRSRARRSPRPSRRWRTARRAARAARRLARRR